MDEFTLSTLKTVLHLEESPLNFSLIGQGCGFLGKVYRVQINERRSVCVKIPMPSLNTSHEIVEFLEQVKPHKRELEFYETVNPLFPPVLDDDGNRYLDSDSPIPLYIGGNDRLLVLEYLADLYVPNFYTGLKYEEVVLAVKALAKLHTTTSNVQLSGDSGLQVWKRPERIEMHELGCLVSAIVKAGAGGERIRLTEELIGAHGGVPMPDNYHSNHKCLINGDCWSSNIMIHNTARNDTTVLSHPITPYAVVIDFQFAHVGSPVEDIATLLCTSMTPSMRRQEEYSLLSVYNEEVRRLGGGLLLTPHDYRIAMRRALHMITLSYETWIATSPSQTNQMDLLERFSYVLIDVLQDM
mmetsp:Transcript_20911/g.30113  ORF Transcript_20911/g.30113 Transcript_20911/m.30113 type:complete len:355 (-) Transcript_20911:8-1072(-)